MARANDAKAAEDRRRTQHSSTEQLRADIDHGRTGDKVDFPDPAAVPLGTDDEAAGTPTPGEIISAVRRAERQEFRQPAQRQHGLGWAWLLVGFILLCACGAVALLFV